MRLRLAIPAGLLDIGAASLATFIAQAYAVRVLDGDALGVYAVFFAAYLFASQATQFLFFYPLEIAVLELPRSDRVHFLQKSMRLAAWGLAVAAAAAIAAALIVGSDGAGLIAGLGLTMAAASAISPVYDHVKRMLHLSDKSWRAAALGQFQLGVLVVILLGMIVAGVPSHWIPFGALAGSQAASVLVGLLIAQLQEMQPLATSSGEMLRSGRWLLISGLTPPLATLVAAGLVTRFAGADELGLAQAAHVASRPILILSAGLLAVLGFRFMEAGASRTASEGNRYWRAYAAIILGGSAIYILVVGFDWFGNPMAALLPRAYELGGLVLLTLVANFVATLSRPPRNELIGAHWEPRVAMADSAASGALVLVAVFAGTFGAFAVPLGVLAFGVVHILAYVPLRRALYATGDSASAHAVRTD